MQKIKLNIANRIYPLNVNPSQEEILRKASKQINDMVNEYEKNMLLRISKIVWQCVLYKSLVSLKNFPKVKATVLMKLTIS